MIDYVSVSVSAGDMTHVSIQENHGIIIILLEIRCQHRISLKSRVGMLWGGKRVPESIVTGKELKYTQREILQMQLLHTLHTALLQI